MYEGFLGISCLFSSHFVLSDVRLGAFGLPLLDNPFPLPFLIHFLRRDGKKQREGEKGRMGEERGTEVDKEPWERVKE